MSPSRNLKGSGTPPLPGGRADTKPLLPYILAGALAFLLCAGSVWLRRGTNWLFCVMAVRLLILIAASVSDLRTRKVKNIYAAAMLISGFYGLDSLRLFLLRAGAMLGGFLFLYGIYHLFPQKTVGGADIKMLAAMTFAFGGKMLPILIYMLALCLLLLPVLLLVRKKNPFRLKIPFFPLMAGGVWLYCLI